MVYDVWYIIYYIININCVAILINFRIINILIKSSAICIKLFINLKIKPFDKTWNILLPRVIVAWDFYFWKLRDINAHNQAIPFEKIDYRYKE